MRSKLLIRTSDGAEFSTERPSQQYVVEYHRGLSISKRHTGQLQPAAGLPLAGDKPGCPMLIRPLSALNALSDAGDKPQRYTLQSGPSFAAEVLSRPMLLTCVYVKVYTYALEQH